MEKKGNILGCATIGYGATHNFGYMHAKWAQASELCNHIGICDQDPKRQAAIKEDFPDTKVYKSLSEVWSDDAVELVSIITPNFTHCELVKEAFANGKHVLVENGMALNADECDQMVQAGKKAGRSLSVHHNRRHDGNYRIIKEIIDSGEIGDIFQIELSPVWYLNPFKGVLEEMWWGDKKRSGGLFFFYASQAFDWILDLLPPERKIVGVNGFEQNRVWTNVSSEDQVTAILKFDDGVMAYFTESYIDASSKPFWRILGTKGAIVDEMGSMISGYQKQVNAAPSGRIKVFKGDIDGGTTQRYENYKESDWDQFYTDMASHILNGTPNPVPGESGRQVLSIIDAAKRSIESGQTETVAFQ